MTCSTFSDDDFAEAVPRLIKPIILLLTRSKRDELLYPVGFGEAEGEKSDWSSAKRDPST